MRVEAFFDPDTSSLTYVVFDEATRDAVVIDPVLDFDPLRVRVGTAAIEKVQAFLVENGLSLRLILETHVHADHLSASQWLKARHGAPVVIGEHVREVQATFRDVFDLGADFPVDGRPFDRLVRDGETFEAGSLRFEVIHTPGHTPACVTYRSGDAVFVGDAIFLPDYGTGRCDFPGGSAERLYASIHRLFTLPDATRVFVGHDYQPGGRALRWESSIGEQKASNKHVRAGTSKDEFVAFRSARDATLEPPRLMLPSVQINVRAGHLPEPAANGRRYLKLPIGLFA